MAKHEHWWPCGILGVGVADELVTLAGRQKPSPAKLTIFTCPTPPKKHQTTPQIPQPSQRDAQQTENTLSVSIKLQPGPQSTKWETWLCAVFLFHHEEYYWLEGYSLKQQPAVKATVPWLNLANTPSNPEICWETESWPNCHCSARNNDKGECRNSKNQPIFF